MWLFRSVEPTSAPFGGAVALTVLFLEPSLAFSFRLAGNTMWAATAGLNAV